MLQSLLVIVAIFLVAASLAGWFRIAWRRLGGQSPLDFQPRPPVPWNIVDVCFFVAVYIVLQMTGGGLVRAALGIQAGAQLDQIPPAARATAMVAGSAATLLAAGVSLLTIFAWHPQATWRDVGWDLRRLAEDLRIGAAAFVLLAPPVYAVQVLLVQWFAYEHPLITLLKERPDPVFLTVSGFTALLVAPLAEEYFFRVLLQGWLEKPHGNGAALLSGREVLGTAKAETSPGSAATEDRFSWTQMPVVGAASVWPMFASAALFGLLHSAHGPAPVPLFLLSLGLGYVYRQTHRLLPCVVAHLLFNACSLATLLLAIRAGGS